MAIVALWRQVDYACRRLAPWEELAQEQTNEEKSLLLDYISPFLLTSLYRAIKFRHWSVVASLLGFMLLKVITVFSTGLLVLSSTQLHDYGHVFETSSIVSAKSYCGDTKPCNYTKAANNLGLEYQAILEGRLPYPLGTTSTSTFDIIDTAGLQSDAIVTTTVPGFYPKFECQVATIHNNSGFPSQGDFDFYGNGSTSLSGDGFNISTGGNMWEVSPISISYCSPLCVVCAERTISTYDLGHNWLPQSSTYDKDLPWLLMVYDIRYNQTISPMDPKTFEELEAAGQCTLNVTHWSARLESSTAVLCNVSYAIEDTRLRIDTAQTGTSRFTQAQGPESETSDHLEYYSDSDLLLGMSSDLYEPTVVGMDIFGAMSHLNAVKDDAEYLDPNVLMETSARAFKMIAALRASETMRSNEKSNLTGTVEYFERRLHIKPLSFVVMAAGFVIMLGLTLILFVSRPRTLLLQDPGSLASYASILATYQVSSPVLADLGSASIAALRRNSRTRGPKTTSVLGTILGSWTLAPVKGQEVSYKGLDANAESQHRTWHPFAASNLFKVGSVTFLTATIAILAILQSVSDKNDGIADIDPSSAAAHYLSTYLAAVFMLLLATLCTSASFAIGALSPYHHLKRGNAKAQRTILVDICGKSPSVVLYRSLKSAMTAPALISTASILSSFLTIVVSGLYTIEAVPLPREMTVTQLDHFNLTWNSSATDNGAMSAVNLLEHGNASFADWTYEELAIPAIEITRGQKAIADALAYNGQTSLTAPLPVMRGSLNCTKIQQKDANVVMQPYNDVSSTCQMLSCGFGVSGNRPDPTFDVYASGGSYCNLPGRLKQGPAVNYSMQLDPGIFGYSSGLQALAGCPSLAFTLGYFTSDTSRNYSDWDTTHKDNVTTFVCSQYLEESTTDVRFLLPGFTIDRSRPPVFNMTNSRVISTEQYEITAYTSQLSGYPEYGGDQTDVYSGIGPPIDKFTQLVLSGTRGIPAAELIHPADSDKAISAVQHIYRLWIAQAINANMRQNFSSFTNDVFKRASPPKLQQATLLDPTRTRLVQNRTSAIVLEVLLGLILVFAAAAYATTKLQGVLPVNPCSIAGVMSLLVGSRLCADLANDAGIESEKGRQQMYKARRYGLGWWDREGRLVSTSSRRKEDAGSDEAGEGNRIRELRFGVDIDDRHEDEKGTREDLRRRKPEMKICRYD